MLRANDYVVVAASEMNLREQKSGSILRRYANASPPVPDLNGGAVAATGCKLKVFGIRKCGRESSGSVMATLRYVKVSNEVAASEWSLQAQNFLEWNLNWHGKEGSEKQPEVAWSDTFGNWHCDAGFGESLPKFMSVDMVGKGGHLKVVAIVNENRGRFTLGRKQMVFAKGRQHELNSDVKSGNTGGNSGGESSKGIKVAEVRQFESFDSFFCEVEMSCVARLELEDYEEGVPPSAGGSGPPKGRRGTGTGTPPHGGRGGPPGGGTGDIGLPPPSGGSGPPQGGEGGQQSEGAQGLMLKIQQAPFDDDEEITTNWWRKPVGMFYALEPCDEAFFF